MTFPNVGTTINSMIKMTELSMKWQERKENINKPKGNESREVQRMREIVEDTRKSNYVQSIRSKLQSGDSLSSAELDYLKANHPDMYQDAMEVRQERERYKRDLESCRTQEEVDRLNISRLNSFVGQAKSISANPNIPMDKKLQMLEKIAGKAMGVQVEYNKFVRAGGYDSLPSEQEEDEKKKKARKTARQEDIGDLMNNARREIDRVRASAAEAANEPKRADAAVDAVQAEQLGAPGEIASAENSGAQQAVSMPAQVSGQQMPAATQATAASSAPPSAPSPDIGNGAGAAATKPTAPKPGGFSIRV